MEATSTVNGIEVNHWKAGYARVTLADGTSIVMTTLASRDFHVGMEVNYKLESSFA